jgi:hypothetical protein
LWAALIACTHYGRTRALDNVADTTQLDLHQGMFDVLHTVFKPMQETIKPAGIAGLLGSKR